MPRSASLIALLAVLATGALAPGAAQARVPRGFMGVVLTEHRVLGDDQTAADELTHMARAGVQSIRTPFYWSEFQPYRHLGGVPAEDRNRFVVRHGVPTDFTRLDRLEGDAARHGLSVLPVVMSAPIWAGGRSGRTITQPRHNGDYTRFLLTLVERYGPRGSFWKDNPSIPFRPIRAWQIWNEPDRFEFWRPEGRGLNQWARPYVRLLRASYKTLRRADPKAKIVLAGFPQYSWFLLNNFYRAGGRGLYDVLAVHPYTLHPKDMLYIIQKCRDVMKRYHDTRPSVDVTEIGYPASRGKVPRKDDSSFSVTTRRQHQLLAEAFTVLAGARKRLRINSVFWFSWATSYRGDYPFDYAGLRGFDVDGVFHDTQLLRVYRDTARRLGR